ncbi:MAG: hypothetical protein IPP72_15405 [Chitinophagaceae bacterium]|nr:hypothetical protein [Chitinophagaceae bacterium]
MNVVLSANAIADISGTFLIGNGCTYNPTAAGAVTTVSGTVNRVGTFTTTGTASNFVITSTGVYIHAINGGTIPPGTWNTGSTCKVTGITSATNQAMSGHRQLFSKFVWDCAGQTNFFVLGASEPNASVPPIMEVTDSFIVYRTNGQILQITSSGGQRDFTVGNYIQYGGIVAVTYNTNASGGQRSLSVNNSFYATDSTENNTKFQIVNTANSDLTNGRLYVGGNAVMRLRNGTTVTLEKNGTASSAEMWFTGTSNQYATFSTVSDSVDFVTAQNLAGFNVTLGSNLKARKFMLTQGTFNIASNTLTIDREVSYPSPGTGTFGGSASSNLTMTMNGGNAGTLNFASGKRILKDFTQTLNNTLTLGTELAITAGATPGRDSLGVGATLNTNDNLVLRSDANGIARMAQIPVNGSGIAQATINGKVTVERYLPMGLSSSSRRWRLLTAPFKSTNSPTINAAWQEGASTSIRTSPVDPKPGYGTQITKNNTWTTDGYDIGSTTNPSIYYYNAGSWVAPANTNVVKITDNSGCYMLFARGDRSIVVSSTSVAAAPTTLDPKGELNIGRVTIPLTASGYQTVGNPYASAIKLDNISFNDTLGNKKTIYLWDPKTLGSFNVGKFITCSGDGGAPATYTYTGNTSAYAGGVIEPSGAFMVKGNGGNIIFNESDKIVTSSTVGIASRPSNIPNALGKISKLYTDLLVIKNGMPILADGVANTYNKYYDNGLNNLDASKLTTFTNKEELSIKREDQLLAIERRRSVFTTDTIFLNISKLSLADYQFDFRPVEFDNRYAAFLEDKFSGTTTLLSLTAATTYSFSITTVPASSVTDRFHIIFKKTATPKCISLLGTLQQNDIALQWDNSDIDDIEPHDIERSKDGINFNNIGSRAAETSRTGEAVYHWIDENPLPGNYYYRIRFTNEQGQPAYSNIVKVVKTTNTGTPAILPNPVINGQVNLYMGQLQPGNYNIRIVNNLGQVIYTGRINHQSINSVEKITVKSSYGKGIYNLEIIKGNRKVTILSLLME